MGKKSRSKGQAHKMKQPQRLFDKLLSIIKTYFALYLSP